MELNVFVNTQPGLCEKDGWQNQVSVFVNNGVVENFKLNLLFTILKFQQGVADGLWSHTAM